MSSTPPPIEHIKRLYAYHAWAGDQLFGAAAALTAEQLDRAWGGSFGTGRGLLRHMVATEQIWVERWGGVMPSVEPVYPATWTGRDFEGEWRRRSAAERAFVEQLDPARLTEDFTYTNMKGVRGTYPFADILVHVVNHGTYHRGQLAQLLRDHGIGAPSTDLLIFARAG